MKYTSAQAAKILRQLKEEHQRLLAREAETQVFLAAVGEDPESLRPEYDYGQVQEKLAGLEEKIRKIRHALNIFNLNFFYTSEEINPRQGTETHVFHRLRTP